MMMMMMSNDNNNNSSTNNNNQQQQQQQQLIERNLGARSYLCKPSRHNNAADDKKFALDVLGLMEVNGTTLDLVEIDTRRRSVFAVSEIPRLRMEGLYSPVGLWSNAGLKEMQFRTKPIAGREFCLNALAMALDFGVDLKGERRLAIAMSMHKRVGKNSLLAMLNPDLIFMLSVMSIGQ